MNEGLLPSLASNSCPFLKYFYFMTWATRELGFVKIRRNYLARSTELKASRFLNPSPPFSSAVPNWSHLFQWMLLSLFWWFYQKLDIIAAMSLRSLRGSLKTHIAYDGIAWITDVVSISLLTRVMNEFFQLESLWHTLFLMEAKDLYLDLSTVEGSPK